MPGYVSCRLGAAVRALLIAAACTRVAAAQPPEDLNHIVESAAQHAPRGLYPRSFRSEQIYWTAVGADGGGGAALLSEDGALQVGRNGYTVEPFVLTSGGLVGWAEVETDQSLQDGYLPIPQVRWRTGELELRVVAFALPEARPRAVVVRYVVGNRSARASALKLVLAVRPLQVDPATQLLNYPGGVHPIHDLQWNGEVVSVDGAPGIRPLGRFAAFAGSTFDGGPILEGIDRGTALPVRTVHDPSGLASGALLFDLQLTPGGEQEVDVLACPDCAGLPAEAAQDPAVWVKGQLDRVAADWREQLGRVSIDVPPAQQPIADTLRSALAQILISRDGPQLRPATHSYARSWIRDGAMMAEALLRLGHAAEAAAFVDWYAGYQFPSGRIPCCVDGRGADPAPENDSDGEFIFAAASLYRYTSDRAQLMRLWPHVAAAAGDLEAQQLSEQTDAIRRDHPEFYGLLPASISHEGYSASPMHSYWDDFWGLRGFKDAAFLARAAGDRDAAARFERVRDEFRAHLIASIRLAAGGHRIDFIPGAAELGDFDPTSTTIALEPGGELPNLPHDLVEGTFERYWRDAERRQDGELAWEDYTPYEWRAVASLIRLGWRERALQLLRFLMAGRRPAGWNQWAEVVGRDARKPRFLGDMPHAWVASDFIRSVLDLFAYERESDRALVLAAGVPAEWLEGDGIGVRRLRTTYGPLSYRIVRDALGCRITIDPSIRIPPGGLVFEWPGPDAPPPVRVNGRPAAWEGAALHIHDLPGVGR